MTKITTITLLCDNPRHGRDEEPATQVRRFGLGDDRYATDLCEADSAALTAVLAPYVAAAKARTAASRPRSRTQAERRHSRQVRMWWGRNQRLVPAVKWTDQGRIPAVVTAEYERRHGGRSG